MRIGEKLFPLYFKYRFIFRQFTYGRFFQPIILGLHFLTAYGFKLHILVQLDLPQNG